MATAENPATRKRAPRRDGERTTLRVPAELAAQAEVLAQRLGTTPNDALVLMAARGAALYAEEIRMAQDEAHQWRAIVEAAGPFDPDEELLSDDDARAAVLLLRSGRFGPAA